MPNTRHRAGAQNVVLIGGCGLPSAQHWRLDPNSSFSSTSDYVKSLFQLDDFLSPGQIMDPSVLFFSLHCFHSLNILLLFQSSKFWLPVAPNFIQSLPTEVFSQHSHFSKTLSPSNCSIKCFGYLERFYYIILITWPPSRMKPIKASAWVLR